MTLFKHTIGHQSLLAILERDLKEKKLSHASLFSGPEHVGKWHVAMKLTKGMFCETACGHCKSCHLVEVGTHPDVSVFRDEGGSLKIETVRSLIHTVSLSAQGGKRVILIQHIERMPTEAQNAFLKTLEEPAGNCFFILTCKNLEQVLPTLFSRLREYHFFTVPHSEIQNHLSNEHRLDKPTTNEITELAQGRPGVALNLLHDPPLRQEYEALYRKVEQFFSENSLLTKMQFAETLEKDPDQLKRFFEMSFYYLRKVLHQGVQSGTKVPEKITLVKVSQLFESLVETSYLIKGNINKRLALENFFLQTET